MILTIGDTVKYRGIYWLVDGLTEKAILLHALTSLGDTFVVIPVKSEDCHEIQKLNHDNSHKENGG